MKKETVSAFPLLALHECVPSNRVDTFDEALGIAIGKRNLSPIDVAEELAFDHLLGKKLGAIVRREFSAVVIGSHIKAAKAVASYIASVRRERLSSLARARVHGLVDDAARFVELTCGSCTKMNIIQVEAGTKLGNDIKLQCSFCGQIADGLGPRGIGGNRKARRAARAEARKAGPRPTGRPRVATEEAPEGLGGREGKERSVDNEEAEGGPLSAGLTFAEFLETP